MLKTFLSNQEGTPPPNTTTCKKKYSTILSDFRKWIGYSLINIQILYKIIIKCNCCSTKKKPFFSQVIASFDISYYRYFIWSVKKKKTLWLSWSPIFPNSGKWEKKNYSLKNFKTFVKNIFINYIAFTFFPLFALSYSFLFSSCLLCVVVGAGNCLSSSYQPTPLFSWHCL